LAIVAQSTAVLPAPITMTLRPTLNFSAGNLAGFNEFQAVQHSLFAGNAQAGRAGQSHAQHNRIELLLERGRSDILADLNPGLILTPSPSIMRASSSATSTGSRSAMMP
jgi:hypothetical protein